MTLRDQQIRRRTALKRIGGVVVAGGTLVGSSSSVAARRGALYNLTFNKDDDAADWTANDPGWQEDRTEPDAWERVTGRPHNNVVRKNIDENEDTSGFFRYQGMKYMDVDGARWNVEIPRRLKSTGSIYIDSDWEANEEERQTGLWYALGDDTGSRNWFEILEYQSSAVTGNGPSFRRWDTTVSDWEDVGVPKTVDPERGGWVGLDLRAEPDGDEIDIEWKVNGKRVLNVSGVENPSGDVDHFQELIVNSKNFGEDQDYYFDNFQSVIN